jgi:hypothetical protein
VTEHLTALVVQRRATELVRAADAGRLARDARAGRRRPRAVRVPAAVAAAAARLGRRPAPAGGRP